MQFIFLYALSPLIIILLASAGSAPYIPAIISTVINLCIQAVALAFASEWGRSRFGEFGVQYLQVVKAKNNLIELFIVIALTFLHSYVVALQINCTRNGSENSLILTVFSGLTCFVSHFSLVAESPREVCEVLGDNSDFGVYSTQYMRPLYGTILLGAKFIFINSANYKIPSIIYCVLPALWFFGTLGSVFVTGMYLLERWNLWLLGVSPGATDLRTIA